MASQDNDEGSQIHSFGYLLPSQVDHLGSSRAVQHLILPLEIGDQEAGYPCTYDHKMADRTWRRFPFDL